MRRLVKSLRVVKLLVVTHEHVHAENDLSFLWTEWALMLVIYTK